MKKLTLLPLLLCLVFLTSADSCDDSSSNNYPNPGFSIGTTRRQGARERPLPGAVTNGDLVRRGSDASGTVEHFRGAVSNNSGRADIHDGVAPAFWRFQAVSNWDICTGQTFSGGINRADLNYFVCVNLADIFLASSSPVVASQLSPNSIDVTAGQVEFTAYADNIDTSYGMPTFQFVNEYGTTVAQTQAAEVGTDHTWACGWSGCLANLPTGPYSVRIISPTADGVGQQVGVSTFYLYGGPIQKAIDDPSFFVRQQYLDFFQREPDDGGWQGWINYITQCGTDTTCRNEHRINTARGFMDSSEFQQRVGGAFSSPYPAPGDTPYNRKYIRQCYLIFLQREPYGGEDGNWLNYLFNTGDYSGVIGGFINSNEYRTRFDPPPAGGATCDPSLEQVSECENAGYRWDWTSCGCDYDQLLY